MSADTLARKASQSARDIVILKSRVRALENEVQAMRAFYDASRR